MLELKNVSKFYSSKGMVTSGFNKVSLKFELGEFVAVTGESGSGKSTLLNVISGLDSYEEGEMYVNGKETSHYTEKDYERYRKKYIGNIFQNFNLVNSYTVYQNIELVLLLNGKRKKDVKKRVLELIKEVDLIKYKNRRVSKLSGGQKQRVAIARALAQDTPIILADEPTGNLDKKSSESVLRLLHDIAKSKLVIVVTHNYDQIEEYVTRKITMHDGHILEDKKLKEFDEVKDIIIPEFNDIKWHNKIRLGIRNAFNIASKFILICTVYTFIVFAIFFAYSSFQKDSYQSSIEGNNMFFGNISDKRIVINKYNKESISEEDYYQILKLDNISKIVKNDVSLDNNIGIITKDHMYYLYGYSGNINEINKVDIGRLPEKKGEVVFSVSKDSYFMDYDFEELMEQIYYIDGLKDYDTNKNYEVKIVGIKFIENGSVDYYSGNSFIYVDEETIEELNNLTNKSYSRLIYSFKGKRRASYFGSIYEEILPSKKVSKGKVVIPDEWSYLCKDMKCKNSSFSVSVNSTYYKLKKVFKVSNSYKKENFNKLTGYKYKEYNGAVYINNEDYENLFDVGYYQSSVIIKDEKLVKETMKDLNNLGYKTLYISETLQIYDADFGRILNIVKVVVIAFLLMALFFISYFIIKLVLKSRNIYYSTLRILGSSMKATKSLLNIELLTISHVAYVIFLTFLLLVNYRMIDVPFILDLESFITVYDYLLLYIVLLLMSLLITLRFSRKLFKNTVMNTYKEEV